MTQHSLTTRLDHYINTMLPETHGHQRKAFRDFGTALLAVRTGCQATLARHFPNFEAASRRLTRWLHNPRVEPQTQARGHAQAVVRQLPLTGTVRIAIDWTTEDRQHLLIASLVVGRRAVPLYWEAYTTAALKGAQRGLEHAFVDQLVGVVLGGLARERVLVTADRGFCTGDFLALLARWGVGFVVRLTAHVTVCLDQQGQQLALAVAAPTLGQRFVVLALSVLYRGWAIPVAWTVLPAGEKQAWRREWLRMLRQVHAAVPRRFFVSGLADRGQ